MISHEHRCIFIHIPRTGGSSFEKWITGHDWWGVEKETKHLLASQAKQLYAEYWDDYFKFAIVRNPWDRMISCIKFQYWFGIHVVKKQRFRGLFEYEAVSFSGYKEKFGSPITLEYDYRFYDREKLIRPDHQPHCVYGNILDEPLDFVGRFEDLETAATTVRQAIGIDTRFNIHLNRSDRKPYREYFDRTARKEIEQLFGRDIEEHGYRF